MERERHETGMIDASAMNAGKSEVAGHTLDRVVS